MNRSYNASPPATWESCTSTVFRLKRLCGFTARQGIGANILHVLVLAFANLYAVVPSDAAELRRDTIEAYNQYVQKAEVRMDNELKSGGPFLWLDGLPAAEKAVAYARLRNGEILIDSRAAGLDIPGGMIHDWIGMVFIPNATLEEALGQIQNYDNYAQIYTPAIVRSRILSRDGDQFTVSLRLRSKSLRTVVLDVVSTTKYFRLDSSRVYSITHSIRIAEIKNPGSSQEREEAPGESHGYLWKLSNYRRILQDASGIYLQFEIIALSRDIPWGLAWLLKPLVTKAPREDLTFTLSRARDSIKEVVKQSARGRLPPSSWIGSLRHEGGLRHYRPV